MCHKVWVNKNVCHAFRIVHDWLTHQASDAVSKVAWRNTCHHKVTIVLKVQSGDPSGQAFHCLLKIWRRAADGTRSRTTQSIIRSNSEGKTARKSALEGKMPGSCVVNAWKSFCDQASSHPNLMVTYTLCEFNTAAHDRKKNLLQESCGSSWIIH
jgi:hypothetical protein